jgi:hypothetical protein
VPDTLTARCGQTFSPGMLEQLGEYQGMPYLGCTARIAVANPKIGK